MPKRPVPPPTPPECRETLGLSPAVLAKRGFPKPIIWCPNDPNNEYDRYSDPGFPKSILFNHVLKAHKILKYIVPETPLWKSKMCDKFGMSLYFKVETGHRTGSFHERSAIYTLHNLSSEQLKGGVFTASLGNWAMALAHQGFLMQIQVTVVLPAYTRSSIVKQCEEFQANVVLHGNNIDEAKTYAFKLIADEGRVGTYLNGYDHPDVIAGAGCMGFEIMNQLPDADAILVPVGGGGLLAGIATVVKRKKPDSVATALDLRSIFTDDNNVLGKQHAPGYLFFLLGIEPGKSCSSTNAIDKEWPDKIEAERSLADSLTVPKAGANAFHTARSLVDKLVLVDDDCTARAILHLIEEEAIVAEGAGAISLGALLCIPDILPELHGKKVVCIISGGNIDSWHLKQAILHGKAAEGRIFTMTIRVAPEKILKRNEILKLIKFMKCNVTSFETDKAWLDADADILHNDLNIICETKDMKQSTALKNVIERLYPNMCEFTGDTFKPKTTCACFRKLKTD